MSNWTYLLLNVYHGLNAFITDSLFLGNIVFQVWHNVCLKWDVCWFLVIGWLLFLRVKKWNVTQLSEVSTVQRRHQPVIKLKYITSGDKLFVVVFITIMKLYRVLPNTDPTDFCFLYIVPLSHMFDWFPSVRRYRTRKR